MINGIGMIQEDIMGTAVKMRVIKRSGEEVAFDLSKIINVIKAANDEVEGIYQMNPFQIQAAADNIAKQLCPQHDGAGFLNLTFQGGGHTKLQVIPAQFNGGGFCLEENALQGGDGGFC